MEENFGGCVIINVLVLGLGGEFIGVHIITKYF